MRNVGFFPSPILPPTTCAHVITYIHILSLILNTFTLPPKHFPTQVVPHQRLLPHKACAAHYPHAQHYILTHRCLSHAWHPPLSSMTNQKTDPRSYLLDKVNPLIKIPFRSTSISVETCQYFHCHAPLFKPRVIYVLATKHSWTYTSTIVSLSRTIPTDQIEFLNHFDFDQSSN